MAHMLPRVYETWLEVPGPVVQTIWLDRPAWFVWLDAPTTTRFAYPLFDPRCGYSVGVMSVRKEQRQRGGWYWSAYRRAGAQLRKHYLGRSATLTHARLAAVATWMLAQTASTGGLPTSEMSQS